MTLATEIHGFSAEIVEHLRQRGETISTAESLTAGSVSSAIVTIAGASDVFVGGTTAYRDEIKISHLGVDPALIAKHSAISEEVAVAMAQGAHLAKPKPVVVPILRAGLGMLEGMSRLIPTAEIGFLGMVRDEKTLKATTYANRLPEDLTNRQCYILDPMLATGGTLVSAIEFLAAKGATDITAICILAAPEGIAVLEKAFATSKLSLKLVTGALDERLNEKGYIIPGLGDAGDRLYGVV